MCHNEDDKMRNMKMEELISFHFKVVCDSTTLLLINCDLCRSNWKFVADNNAIYFCGFRRRNDLKDYHGNRCLKNTNYMC